MTFPPPDLAYPNSVKQRVPIYIVVELVQVGVNDKNWFVRRSKCDDRVHFHGIEVRVKVE